MELGADKVYMEEFLLPSGSVRAEVLIVCHSLAEMKHDTFQDDVDKVIVSYPAIDIKSINIMHVFPDCTYLFEIADLVKSPVQLVVVVIGLSNGVLDFFSSIKPMLIRCLPF